LAFEIGMGLHVQQSVVSEQRDHGWALIVMVFQEQPATWCQGSWGLCDKAANASQAVATAIESQARLVIAHNGIQLIHRFAGDVRRVGEHQGQLAPPRCDSVKPISRDQAHAVVKANLAEIAPGLPQGGGAQINRQPMAIREGSGQSQGQAATSSAQIRPDKPPRVLASPLAPEIDSQINHAFRFWPWDEHPGPNLKGKVSPETLANQVLKGHRFGEVLMPKPLDAPP
jgi:hypothetical protein